MQQNTACPACGRETPVTSAAFCPYCGAPLDQSAPMDGAAQAALDKALKESDPVKKHRLLLQAREQHPDCLPIEEELLHLGRLYERSASTLDYSVIKCYLLQLYLAPEELSGDKRDAMRRELFCDPQLLACQRLAPDAEAFTRQYLERLSTEFIRIFLRGSNRYMQSMLGFRMESRAPKLLAQPAADMLARMRRDTELTADQRDMLYAAFYAAFARAMSGETKWLTEALAAREG